MSDIETVVVGAGVVGLAIARALTLAGHEVIVLERHARVGSETSSRNSEVIHAGLYYPAGSMRARLCVAGKEALYRFCAENAVTHARVGKLLVATSEAELPRLEAIAANAAANGVTDLSRLTATEAKAMEPELQCIAAYLSPSTGIIDSHELMQALSGHIAANRGEIVLNASVDAIAAREDGFQLEVLSAGEVSTLSCRNLVLAGGLGATRLGRMLSYRDGYTVPETYPARGHYFALSGKAPFQRLIYPMPVGAWLGIHLTIDTGGRTRFGPDIEWCDEVDYKFIDDDGRRLATFEREVRRYWPGLPDGALHPDTVGIRPKLYREGEPAGDFVIHTARDHGNPHLVALYGIESPGLTSSLAIADYVAERLQ